MAPHGTVACWALREALEMASDLRGRGYADAHAQRWIEGASLPPFALTLSVKRRGW